jgi:hypothetical protein
MNLKRKNKKIQNIFQFQKHIKKIICKVLDFFTQTRIASRTRISYFFCKKEKARLVRKVKQANLTGENLSLRKRRIETLNAKRKRQPGLKDKSPDRS